MADVERADLDAIRAWGGRVSAEIVADLVAEVADLRAKVDAVRAALADAKLTESTKGFADPADVSEWLSLMASEGYYEEYIDWQRLNRVADVLAALGGAGQDDDRETT